MRVVVFVVLFVCAGCGLTVVRPTQGVRAVAPSLFTLAPAVQDLHEFGYDKMELQEARFLPGGDLVTSGVVRVVTGGTDLGTGPLPRHKKRRHAVCFVARHAASGEARWVKRLHVQGLCPRLTVSGAGRVWLSGSSLYDGPRDWTAPYDAKRAPRSWIKELDSAGRVVRTIPIEFGPSKLWAGPKGELVVGFFLSRGRKMWGHGARGKAAFLIARISPGDGAPMWKRLVEPGSGSSFGVASGAWTPQGDLVWAGRFRGEVALDAGHVLRAPKDAAYVLKMSAKTGETRWTKVFTGLEGGGTSMKAREVVVGARGESYVTWRLRRSAVFGKKTAYVTGQGKSRTAVTKLTPAGEVAWVRLFQGEGDTNRPKGLALGSDGSPVVAVRARSRRGYLEIGGTLYRDISDRGTFLVRLDAATGGAKVLERWRGKALEAPEGERATGGVDVVGLRRGRGAVWGIANVDGEVELGGERLRTPYGWTEPCENGGGRDRHPRDCVGLWTSGVGVVRRVE